MLEPIVRTACSVDFMAAERLVVIRSVILPPNSANSGEKLGRTSAESIPKLGAVAAISSQEREQLNWRPRRFLPPFSIVERRRNRNGRLRLARLPMLSPLFNLNIAVILYSVLLPKVIFFGTDQTFQLADGQRAGQLLDSSHEQVRLKRLNDPTLGTRLFSLGDQLL